MGKTNTEIKFMGKCEKTGLALIGNHCFEKEKEIVGRMRNGSNLSMFQRFMLMPVLVPLPVWGGPCCPAGVAVGAIAPPISP